MDGLQLITFGNCQYRIVRAARGTKEPVGRNSNLDIKTNEKNNITHIAVPHELSKVSNAIGFPDV